jgi:hypothetical protein
MLPSYGTDTKTQSYPFVEPTVFERWTRSIPPGSTIQIGEEMIWISIGRPVALDGCLNLPLKIKESVLQGEPFHAAALRKCGTTEATAKYSVGIR